MKNNASLAYGIILVIGDFLSICAAFGAAYILRVTLSDVVVSNPISALDYIQTFASLTPLWILTFALLGLYTVRIYDNRFSEFGRLLAGTIVGILLIIAYGYIFNTPIFPARLVVLYGFLLAFFFALLFRTVTRAIRRQLFAVNAGITNALIVGDTKLTAELVQALAVPRRTGYRIVGVVGGRQFPIEPNTGQLIFSSFKEATETLQGHLPHAIIQTELYASSAKNSEILVFAQEHHIDYRFVPGNSDLFVGNLEVELFQSVPMIAVHQTALIGWGRVVKRLADIALSLIALVLTSPIMLLTILALALSSRDSVFFRQPRLTRHNHVFKVFKFRSQYAKYDGTTPEEAFERMGKPELAAEYRANGDYLAHDPRITPIGRFLRRSSIDELPQLLNVLKGDISLVGPRALVPHELAQYQKRHAILSVKSGMTGLAQVSGRRDISFDERRKLDLYYVQNWTFWGDMVIIVRTVWSVLFHKGSK